LENGGIKSTSSCLLQIQLYHSRKVGHLTAWRIDHLRVLCNEKEKKEVIGSVVILC